MTALVREALVWKGREIDEDFSDGAGRIVSACRENVSDGSSSWRLGARTPATSVVPPHTTNRNLTTSQAGGLVVTLPHG